MTFTLTQLRAKINEREPFKSNIKKIPNGTTCRFEKCDNTKSLSLQNSKLYMGTYTFANDTISHVHSVRAHILALTLSAMSFIDSTMVYPSNSGI